MHFPSSLSWVTSANTATSLVCCQVSSRNPQATAGGNICPCFLSLLRFPQSSIPPHQSQISAMLFISSVSLVEPCFSIWTSYPLFPLSLRLSWVLRKPLAATLFQLYSGILTNSAWFSDCVDLLHYMWATSPQAMCGPVCPIIFCLGCLNNPLG